MKLGGYGYRPGVSPPMGRRLSVFDGFVRDQPTDDWASLIAAGYGVVYGALIDGIPYVLGERELYTILGVEAAPPTDDYTRSAALAITPGMSVSCEIDREKGIAAGRALDIVLRRQSLEDEGLTTALFKDPSLTAVLTTDVVDVGTTTFAVDSTTGWDPDGLLYCGQECARYSSTSTTSFDGLERGVAGLAHYHAANAASGYAEVTDVPRYWRGRFVSLFEHLVGPDGRYLGTYWCVPDTYCRELWAGTIDAEPQEVPLGKSLRCLPLVRLAGAEIGAKFAFEVAHDGQADPLLWFTRADQIAVHADGSVDGAGPHDGSIGEFATLAAWCSKAAADISSDVSGSATVAVMADGLRPPLRILVNVNATSTGAASVRAQAWFLAGGSYGSASSSDASSGFLSIPIDFNSSPSAWLVIRAIPSEDFAVADVPQSGTAIIESGSLRERVRWDQRKIISTQPDLVGLRLVEREVDGTPRTDPWRYGGTVTIVAGTSASWSDAARTLLTSSGTGDRGTYDTLGFGFGIGLPDDALDLDAFEDEPMSSTIISAASDERRGIGDVLGGWLALWSRCLVQRRNAAGRIVLAPVSTIVMDDPTAPTLGAADVLLDGHGTPEVLEAPNTLKCDASGYEAGSESVIYRDASRVQAESQRMWTLRTPGATQDDVDLYAPGLLKRVEGQAAVSLEALPSCELQPGDRVALTTAHPTVYDWSSGTYGPASVNALVHSVEIDLWSGVRRLVLLLQGRGSANALLCPSARVTRVVSSTVVEVTPGDEGRFAVGDALAFYEPGNETATRATSTVASINGIDHTITFAGSILTGGAYTNPWVTFDVYTAAVGDQAEYMFVRSDKRWR